VHRDPIGREKIKQWPWLWIQKINVLEQRWSSLIHALRTFCADSIKCVSFRNKVCNICVSNKRTS
jgi:hypothetical protein